MSLNAIVGDNGVITNAMDAKIELKCQELQEYIQQFYVENYDYFENASSKINGLKSCPYSSGWIYSGKMGYIVDNSGKVHYYLDCEQLPEEAKKIIGSLEPKSYSDYVDGNDVYGITEDLEVYYSVEEGEGKYKYYGKKNLEFSEEDGSEVIFKEDSLFGKILEERGIGENGIITRADLRKVSDITLTKDSGITNLNDLYNFPNLTKLVLEGVNFENLNGIEYSSNLKTVYIKESQIKNYSNLAYVSKLESLFFYKATDDEIKTLCDNNLGIGGKDLNKLKYFGIFGSVLVRIDDPSGDAGRDLSQQGLSKFSNVKYFENLSEKTKNNIIKLYLNNNSIENIDNLYEFKNVNSLYINGNYIKSLKGIFNIEKNLGMVKLGALYAQKNNLGCDEEYHLNPDIDSLSSFSKANKKDDGYNFIKNLTAISTLDLSYNNNLKYVDYLKPLDTLKTLYLDNCSNLSLNSLASILDIINKSNCNLDSETSFYLASMDDDLLRLDLTTKNNGGIGRTIKESDFRNLLYGKNKLKWLKLNYLNITDENEISLDTDELNSCIEDVLGGLPSLEFLGLKGISELTSINFVKEGSLLRELDLRETGVVDLGNLEKYMLKSSCLWIDNSNINVEEIQNLISRCLQVIDKKDSLYGGYARGIKFSNQELADKLRECTEITHFCMGQSDDNNFTFDLRNCSKLDGSDLGLCSGSFYLPSHITEIGSKDTRNWSYDDRVCDDEV